MGDIKPKNYENVSDITPGIQKVLTDTSNIPLKKLKDKDNKVINNILESLVFEKI